LLEPQERLDQLIATTNRRCGGRIVDLSYANVYDGPDEEVLNALEHAIRDHGERRFQYTPYGGRTITRRLIASTLNQESGLDFTFRDIVMTPGAMAALNVVFRALFGIDDEVLVLTPCWHDYPLYLRNLGIRVSPVPLTPDKHLDLAAISRAIGPRTRGVLLSQPCCPTGVLYGRTEIDELARLLTQAERRLGTRIHLVSDEVHRQLVWSRASFHSPLLCYPRSVSIYSFGKALALQGQRIGYVAVSPEMPENHEVRQALERSVRLMGFCGPTELMQRAICELLDYRPRLDLLAQQQTHVRAHLTSCGYDVCEAGATFFVYAKCPIPDDFAFAAALASLGVLVVPSTLFHETGYFRVSLTARSSAIASALPAFAQVLEYGTTRVQHAQVCTANS
jgi:aspartate aminotransferase